MLPKGLCLLLDMVLADDLHELKDQNHKHFCPFPLPKSITLWSQACGSERVYSIPRILSTRKACALTRDGSARVLKLLGGALYAAGDHCAAKSALEQALTVQPNYPDAWCDLGKEDIMIRTINWSPCMQCTQSVYISEEGGGGVRGKAYYVSWWALSIAYKLGNKCRLITLSAVYLINAHDSRVYMADLVLHIWINLTLYKMT